MQLYSWLNYTSPGPRVATELISLSTKYLVRVWELSLWCFLASWPLYQASIKSHACASGSLEKEPWDRAEPLTLYEELWQSTRGDSGIAAVSSSNSANTMKKLPQGLNYWRLLLRVFWYNWEHRGSLISLSYDLKVKTRACRALSELWACSSQTSKKSNSHKTLQGWIAYLNIKDLLSLNHLTHNHINCILRKKSIEYGATEKKKKNTRGFKEGFGVNARLKVETGVYRCCDILGHTRTLDLDLLERARHQHSLLSLLKMN